MLRVNNSLWTMLEEWDETIFLVAGGSLLVTAAVNGLDVFTAITTQEGILLSIEGATGFGGAVLLFIGVLGLYPRLVQAAPRLARVGLLLAIGPGIFFAGLLVVCSVLAPLLGFPALEAAVPSFGLITAVILVSFASALTLFGVGCLRTSVPSRTVGGLLLLVAGAWYGIVGAILVYYYHTPVWVTFLQTAIMAVSIVGIGVHLRSAAQPTAREELSADPTI